MEDSINPFKGFSKEEIGSLFTSLDRSESISKGVKAHYDSMDELERKELCRRNQDRWTLSERLRASERAKVQWSGYSKERREEELSKVFLNEEYRDKFREFHKNMSSQDREEWLARSFNSEERNESYRRFLDGMSPEEKSKYVRLWLSGHKRNKEASEPEIFLNLYLDSRFPTEWMYNGNKTDGVILGGKVPDFVNVNGKKSVLEVFGRYWHKEDEVEEKIKHYKQFGFDCKVIWEEDCYLWEELDKIFGVASGQLGIVT